MITKNKTLHQFPAPLPLKKLIGPSFVILALGLGSGEIILWPYLAANYGLGIAWGALLGITFQYFINMEIERYALVKGESVFVGIAKFWKFAPIWFIISTFAGFGLPGIIAASAKVFASIIGIEDFRWVAIAFLIVIGLILSSGKTVYGLMEKLTKTILLVGVPFIFLLAIILSRRADWWSLAQGLVGQGDGYSFLPAGIALATFLGAFAYSGAGGNLNLTQSIYIKEKGYGMGKYAQKIAGLFKQQTASQASPASPAFPSPQEEFQLEGEKFEMNKTAEKNFFAWWRKISIEHAIVFWFIGALSISLLVLLSYVTTFGNPDNATGINFVLSEGLIIGKTLGPIVGWFFLLAVSIMLFQTQLGVMDSTSRIMAENAAIAQMKMNGKKTVHLSKIYYSFVWTQIAFGILLFLLGLSEPKTLIILGACLNAVAMFVHIGLVSILNRKELPKIFQPRLWRKILLGIIFVFFGVFSVVVFIDQVF
ncbi:MAG: Nramp family divalent metal transporter [Candidatus Uhrbacteria bacterium]